MKLRSLRIKISFWAGLCLMLTATIIVSYSALMMKERAEADRQRSLEEARKHMGATARQYANEIKAEMKTALDTAATLAHVLSALKSDIHVTPDRTQVNTLLKTVLDRNPGFFGIFTCWETDAFDGKDLAHRNMPGHDETGRFIPHWSRADGEILLEPLTDYDEKGAVLSDPQGDASLDACQMTQEMRSKSLTDPCIRVAQGIPDTVVSLTAPIMTGDMFHGIIGVDLPIRLLQEQLEKMDRAHIRDARLLLISHNGTLAAITERPDLLGKHMKHLHKEHFDQEMLRIRKGEEIIEFIEDHLEIFIPVRLHKTGNPWSLSILAPMAGIVAVAEQKWHQSVRDIWKMIGVTLLCIAVAMGVLWQITETIARPIRKASHTLKDIAEGDLTKRLDIRSDNELGMLAKWFNLFLENYQNIIKDIAGNVDTLNTSSRNFSDISGKMKAGTDEISSKSTEVASATEEVATNINTMASAVEEMSVNVQSVSSTAEEMAQNMNTLAMAIEDMTSAINNIAHNAQEGASVSTQAMEMAKAATAAMNTLGDAAMEIDEVTELIKKIAEQTNLLALNATIEAASAGEAGKGFAVVAKEIKELANQSSQAAENIAKRIKDVQKNTIEAVKVIDKVSEIINNINESSTVIMNSVEQQTLTANNISASIRQVNMGAGNIASSIAEVAKGSNDMSRNAAEAAKGGNDVSSNIQDISHAAVKTNAEAKQVDHSAGELAKVAGELQKMVAKFKIEI